MNFIKNIFSTVIGIFVFLMLFFFIIILFGAIFGGSDEVTVKDNSVLELNLDKITLDYAGKFEDPLAKFFSDKAEVGVTDIVNAIENAKNDDHIKGISILNNNFSLGLTQSKAIRKALLDFKKSKKFIVSYADMYSQKEYYLNSVADTIYLNPIGEIDFKGLSSEVMYYKDFQEKTGVKMEIIRHGKYKSAVEPFLENKMSDANREQLTALLSSVWNDVVSEISLSRNIPTTTLNSIADNLLGRNANLAKTNKLIDKIGYEDEYHNGIRKALKVDKDDDYNTIDIQEYAENNANTPKNIDASDKIAIIYAQGQISGGEGKVDEIGEGAMRKSLQEARKDDDVKAIVLRINSPGGSALTSELIWREIEITKKVKPIVVSMGNVAASGGYYIACNANKIFAENTTITGSIGVFGNLLNMSELSSKWGLNTEVVSTNKNAANYTPFKPLSAEMRAFAQESVESIYTTFVNRVMAGRKMTFEQVDAIGQGRVWSGADALKIGLVDKIGGMEDALKEAAILGKTKKYRTIDYPEFDDKFADDLKNLPFAQSKEKMISEEVGAENYELYKKLKSLKTIKGNQLMLPYLIEIK